MNRGLFQSYVVQQMMGGSPSWWSMSNMRPSPEQISPPVPSLSSSSSSSMFSQYSQPSSFLPNWHDNQDLPESWSQLLLGGLAGEDERCSSTPFQPKKIESWEDQVAYPAADANIVGAKKENSVCGYAYSHGNEEIQASKLQWSQVLPASSPRSCVTTSYNSSMLDFSNSKSEKRHQQPDNSSECNSTESGSSFKKAKIQGSSSAQSTFKVRKEKLGDRITALHQLVSPFGKTDTASVLGEAIGYIRFLQGQIEALSSPYLANGSGNSTAGHPGGEDELKDLRSRGLCLAPVPFTLHVGGDSGADHWPATLGGCYR
ncbi:transcription factor bHLH68-like isoform X1 [Typha latifolia]|uniref:transcription factor bHLH68-like isoform X1 n=1 Tax=Typha latifolia TaxID=4733 RepID=UPI003C2FB5FE